MAIKVFAVFSILIAAEMSWATDWPCKAEEQIQIENIEISGNNKTNTNVLLREMPFAPGDTICPEQIQEGLSRLQRTGLFASIEHNLSSPEASGKTTLKIQVTERWTTIPILKFNSGGGVTQYTLGVYDPNAFGKFLELGLQYENLAGADSGVVWFKNPRLFDERQGIDLQYWNTKRIRIKYDQDKDGPEVLRGFLHEREKLYIDYFREIKNYLVGRISFDYNKDRFSNRLLPDSVVQKIGTNPELPPSTDILISKIGAEFGVIEGESHTLSGQMFGAYIGAASALDGKTKNFSQADLRYTFFKPFAQQWLFAQRLLAGATDTNVLQYWYYLGGLDRIRGYSDNRFAGKYFALSNSELRYLMLQKPSYHVQAVGFVDLAGVGEETQALTKLGAASLGAGARLILPKFYRFVLRLDYAKPIIKSDTMNWSFGVQQFF